MRTYNFIKFGEHVLWMNDTTDTCRTMQVCCPLPNPITDNSKIELIPADDSSDYIEEEESKSYSVSASELFPLLTSYNNGYWNAFQTALTVGADTTILSAMLRNSSLTFEKCLLYMQYSSTYDNKLYSIVDSLFPEESKFFSHIQTISWNGKNYPSKTLTIFKGTNDEQEVTVSITQLSHELIDNKTSVPVSDEAESLDGEIYFYLEEKEIHLSDDDIIAIVEQA